MNLHAKQHRDLLYIFRFFSLSLALDFRILDSKMYVNCMAEDVDGNETKDKQFECSMGLGVECERVALRRNPVGKKSECVCGSIEKTR